MSATNEHKLWTKEEDEYIISKYGTIDTKVIASNLGRTVKAVYYRRSFLVSKGWFTYHPDAISNDEPYRISIDNIQNDSYYSKNDRQRIAVVIILLIFIFIVLSVIIH